MATTDIMWNPTALEVLRKESYENWSVCLKNYLIAQDLWDIMISSDDDDDKPEDLKLWRRKNAAALLAIQLSTDSNLLSKIRHIDSAKLAWHELAKTHQQDQSFRDHEESIPGILDPSAVLPQPISGVTPPEVIEEEIKIAESTSADGKVSPRPQRMLSKPKARFVDLEIPLGEEKGEEEIVDGKVSPLRRSFSKPKSRFEELEIPLEEEKVEEQKEGNEKEDESQRRFRDLRNYAHFGQFVIAIDQGDLEYVKSFIQTHPDAKNAKLGPTGVTALHIATNAGHLHIVKELVRMLPAFDLESKDDYGNTALSVAAQNGAITIAECLIDRNEDLLGIKNKQRYIPVVLAAMRRHKEMTSYLYRADRHAVEDEENGSMLIVCCIIGKILDVALDLISRCPWLATVRTIPGTSSPIRALSRMSSIFPSGSKLSIWERLIYSQIPVRLPNLDEEFHVRILGENCKKGVTAQVRSQFRKLKTALLVICGMKKLHDMKLMHRQALEILDCMCQGILTAKVTPLNFEEIKNSLFRSVQYGTVEFVVEMAKIIPSTLYQRDKNSRGVFLCAVQFRQEKMFSLLYGLGARKDSLITMIDAKNNTISHLAGLLAPSSQLSRISGAPLQMQRELQWFKEVKSMVGSMHEEYFNSDKETPNEVFTKNHKQLMKDGEEWMKQTASSSTVVGALIITIMFTAAFTIPGGNDQNTGYPMFLHKKVFTIFIVSDAISLFFSSTSVLMFLAILTSRYAEEDFLKALPTKLILGLSTLFISIASMMVAFCAALILMLKGRLCIVIPLVSLACIPIAFFIMLQFPLLVDIFMSTYGPSIFNRKMKSWLQPRKVSQRVNKRWKSFSFSRTLSFS